MPSPTLEDLYLRDDTFAVSKTSEFFTQRLMASPSVRDLFFPGTLDPSALFFGFPLPRVPSAGNPAFFEECAAMLVCQSIARSALYGFNACVDKGFVDAHCASLSKDPAAISESKLLYDYCFRYWSNDGSLFDDYYADALRWAAGLADRLTAPDYLNVEMVRILNHEPNWPERLRFVLYKLFLLDVDQAKRVLEVWQKTFPERTFVPYSGVKKRVPFDTWVPADQDPRPVFDSSTHVPRIEVDVFLPQVNRAIAVKTTRSQTSGGTHGGHTVHDNTYGEEVWGFLQRDPARRFASGVQPDNTDETHGHV